MKLSCLPVSLYDDVFSGRKSVSDWVHFAATLGLDGVDFSVKFFSDREAEGLNSLRAEIEEVGIEPCMLACYSDFTQPDPDLRESEIEQMREDLQLAATLGIRFVRVTAGQRHPGVAREQGVQWVVTGFRQALDEAEKLGVGLAYENHTKGAPWQYWDFSQPQEIFLEILDNLADTPLKVCFDTANCLVMNEDAIALLETVKNRVAIVHAFDIQAAGSFEPVLVGSGVAPNRQVFSILKRAGFDGWVSIEEASRSGREGFEKAISFVRSAWEEV